MREDTRCCGGRQRLRPPREAKKGVRAAGALLGIAAAPARRVRQAHCAAAQAAPVTFRWKGDYCCCWAMKCQAPSSSSSGGGRPGRQWYRSASPTQRVQPVVILVPQVSRLPSRTTTFVIHSVRNVTMRFCEQREGTCCCDGRQRLRPPWEAERCVSGGSVARLRGRSVSPQRQPRRHCRQERLRPSENVWRCPFGLSRCQASLPFRLLSA